MKVRCACIQSFEDSEKLEPLKRKKRSLWSRHYAKMQRELGVVQDVYFTDAEDVLSYEEIVEKGGYSR